MDFLRELYKTKYNLFLNYALPLVKNNYSDAEDVVNDVFVNAITYFKKKEIIPDKINSFIFTSIHNKVKDNLDKKDALNFKAGFEKDKEMCQSYNIDHEIIIKVISKIHGYDFFIKMINGYSYNEIAEYYDKKIGYVRLIIHNFRKKAINVLSLMKK